MNKTNLKKRIIIGSANFAQKYSAAPTKIDKKEIKKILNLSKKNNIFKIDTAEGYFNEINLFKNMDKKFKFTTKMKPDHRWTSLDFCQEKIENHFKKFNSNEIQTLLFHDTDILFKKIGTKIFQNIETLKKKKYFKKIGLSIYDTECLNYLVPNYSFDVVQCPYNILDKRIINSGWFNKLKDKGIEIHIRSIFLQGLLVNKLVYKKKYFKKWRFFFIKWFQNLENNNISPIDYCLSDLLNHDFDQIIIGINNYDNLKEIINFKIVKNKKMLNFKKTELKLIDPRNWK